MEEEKNLTKEVVKKANHLLMIGIVLAILGTITGIIGLLVKGNSLSILGAMMLILTAFALFKVKKLFKR